MLLASRKQPFLWPLLRTGRLGSSAVAASGTEGARHFPDDGKTLLDFLPANGCAKVANQNPFKAPVVRKPPWLKMYNPNLTVEGAAKYNMVKSKIKENGLATVCSEARCPNAGECWSSGTATVMIMGDTCTRGCRFCSVATSRTPPPLDPGEPEMVADAVKNWGLDYIVLTMVDRDDLLDQGASHVAATVKRLKSSGQLRVETLCGDFQGNLDLVRQVLDSGMDVFAHNIETVERLTRTVRDRRAGYQQTLTVLRAAREYRPDVVTKSSIMLGFGETDEEVHQTMKDLRDAGVEILTFGQYLQPTKRHMQVTRFVTPDEFYEWKVAGEALGFDVASGPLVRSSYRAGEFFKARQERRAASAAHLHGEQRIESMSRTEGPFELNFSDAQRIAKQPHV